MENLQLVTKDCVFTTLSDIATILQNEMSNAFRELEVNITACPSLNIGPYYLAGTGLCGNTSVIRVGSYAKFSPTPQLDTATWNIRNILGSATYRYDNFIIGAGYAAKPQMPYNGHLIMNAMYNAPEDITNASRIVFADEITRQSRIETLTDPDHMTCSLMGNFFVSEGRAGNVIKVRATGRRFNVDIITLMQDALYRRFDGEQDFVALGGVLKVRNGRVAHNVIPQQYPPRLSTLDDLAAWFQCHEMGLQSDLIAVGTIDNEPVKLMCEKLRHGYYLPIRSHHFHSFSDYSAGGQFIGDTAKDTTEYEGYFNLARKIHYFR